VYDFLKREKIATESPLMQWLHSNYRSAFAVETYEFLVRKDRSIAAVGTAVLHESDFPLLPRFKISVLLNVSALAQFSSVDLVRFQDDTVRRLASWRADDSRVVVTPLKPDGSGKAKGTECVFPFKARGLLRLDIYSDRFPANLPPGRCGLRLFDPDGNRMAEARFIE
jgi:hypothetical protein